MAGEVGAFPVDSADAVPVQNTADGKPDASIAKPSVVADTRPQSRPPVSAASSDGIGSLSARIEDMKKQQGELLSARKRVQKDLRNAERKRRRLKDKARMLTDDDLLAVLRIREDSRKDRLGEQPGESISGEPSASSSAQGKPCPQAAGTGEGDAERVQQDARDLKLFEHVFGD